MFFQKRPVGAKVHHTLTHNVDCECVVFHLCDRRSPHCVSRSRSSRFILSLFSRPEFKSPVLQKLNNLCNTMFCQSQEYSACTRLNQKAQCEKHSRKFACLPVCALFWPISRLSLKNGKMYMRTFLTEGEPNYFCTVNIQFH